jgi:signal transduction histidine kinase
VPALIFALAAWQTWRATLTDADQSAQHMVATLAEHALKVFDTNGLALDLIDEATRGLSCSALRTSTTIPASMARAVRHAPQIETVFVLDERGVICAASRPDRIDDASRADRDHFTGARDAPLDPATGEPAFYVGRGMIGRIGAVPFFSLSRRRSTPTPGADGGERAFQGTVIAAIELKYMIDYWRGIGQRGLAHRIALYRSDGSLLARSVEPLIVPPDPELERRIAATWANAPEGVVTDTPPFEGGERVRAWKVLPRWGIVAIASIDKADVLSPWRAIVLLYGLIAVVASSALFGVSAAALRWVRREEATAQQGREELARRLEAEAQLRQAQRTEALGRLTGGVAHDFNNLLMAVTASLEMLRKRLSNVAGVGDDPRITRLLDNAMQGAQRGAGLTQRMLAFARRQDLKPESVHVPHLVRGMSDLLRRSLSPMVQVEIHFPMRLAPAYVDAHQLELALLNLALNARDAMGSLGGTLTIAAREAAVEPDDPASLKPGFYVCVSVTDTGKGMDEATLQRATEPFFTTKGLGKGTGLGLSMVQGLAEQSGGRLVLSSRKGEGTTAELWLPRAESEDLALIPSTGADEAQAGAAGPVGSYTVLLVDDDPLVLLGTASMLEDLGHAVVGTSSGWQALEYLRSVSEVDLVITDYAMPGMTGLQLAAKVKALRPDLPMIMATGYGELPDGKEPGLWRMGKPFTQVALAKALAEVCAAAAERKAEHSSSSAGPIGMRTNRVGRPVGQRSRP